MSRLGTFISLAVANVLCLNGQQAQASNGIEYPQKKIAVASDRDKDYDPGKEITENPHGPNPHGKDPHGPDPYDEQHDKNLPANNPDRYLYRM